MAPLEKEDLPLRLKKLQIPQYNLQINALLGSFNRNHRQAEDRMQNITPNHTATGARRAAPVTTQTTSLQ